MARMQTLAQLRTRARRFADMTGSLFVSDDEWGDYINQGICALETELETLGAFERRTLTAAITTAAGVESVTIPDALAVFGVELTISGRKQTLDRIEFDQRNSFQDSEFQQPGEPRFFRVTGTSCRLYPTPNAIYSGTVYYHGTSPGLSFDGESYDGVNGWDNAVVWDAVATALAKQEGDPRFALAQRDRWMGIITKAAQRLNASASPTVTDVYARPVRR